MSFLKVVIAPSGFKECLSPEETSTAIAAGVRRALPGAEITELPLVDGGEGFTHTLVSLLGGKIHKVKVTGPVGKQIHSFFGMLNNEDKPTAIIEMAAAAGLRLVPKKKRDPGVTTTYGVGELIKAALDAGARRIILGCGDSGTNDGGAGAVQALGVKMLKPSGLPVDFGGRALLALAEIDTNGVDKRLAETEIIVVCNITNVLCGEQGVSRVYGPQKGASKKKVAVLEHALENYAAQIESHTGLDVRYIPGGGASGGLGAGIHALLGAKLFNRWEIIFKYFDLDKALEHADLVFTAEGGINFQTSRGKIPAEVARRAKLKGLPVFVLAGKVGEGAEKNYKIGIDAIFSILSEPCTLEESMANCRQLLARSAENVMRAFLAGRHTVE
ncbi:MAG TPA: glycerate kinase [Adhaeribacter sp.]|nr:glycerate kinase [Adhaeribacter sp.]